MMQRDFTSIVLCLALLLGSSSVLASPEPNRSHDFYKRHNKQFREHVFPIDTEKLLLVLTAGTQETVLQQSSEVHFVVNIPARELSIYKDGQIERNYPVTIGRRIYRTPVGPRKFSELIWNPWWYPPDAKWAEDDEDTPPGPRNPLGKVKIPLGGAILIHGTNQPRSIGRAASHGCMRMHNHDIIELATWLQQNFSDRYEDPKVERHQKHWFRHSLAVPLNQPIPFEIVYQTIQVSGDEVVLYPDIYQKSLDPWKELQEALAGIGVELSDIDLERLPNGLEVNKTTILPILELLRDRTAVIAAQDSPLNARFD